MFKKLFSLLGYEKKQPKFTISTDSHSTSVSFLEVHHRLSFTLGTFPSTIKYFLNQSRLSKHEFARKCGVTTTTLDRAIRTELKGGYASLSLLHSAAIAAGYLMEPPRLEPKDPKDPRFQTA